MIAKPKPHQFETGQFIKSLAMEEEKSPTHMRNADKTHVLERENRLRRRNVTMDWEGVEAEKRRTLKQARGNAKQALTVALRQISDALLAEDLTGDAVASE